MEQNGRKRGRRARAAYFAPTASGEYIYNGPLYRQQPDQRYDWHKAMTRRWVMGIAIPALCLVCGLLPIPGMARTFYVLIPYAAGLICAGTLLWAVVQMAGGEKGLREYVYEATVKKLPVRTGASAICAGLTLAGEALYLLLEGPGDGQWLPLAVFFAAEGAVLCMSVMWNRMEGTVIWEK